MRTSILILLLFAGILQAKSQSNPLWMRFPAVSPDGKQIAFSYMGDIFKVSSSGGDAVPLTLHEAYDYAPVWSPDGKSIAFASNRFGNMDVFIMPSTGGVAERLTFHSADDAPSDFSGDGSKVIFSSSRLDLATNQQFPSGVLPELYEVHVKGGRVKQILTTPALDAKYNADGTLIVFHDQKGYEDDLRKHHTSSVARDLWLYNVASQSFEMLTNFEGEDRNPVFAPGEKSLYYLSEKNGSFNVFKYDLNSKQSFAITSHTAHPVRNLSLSDNGLICYSLHGEIYTLMEGGKPGKVNIRIASDLRYNPIKTIPVSGVSDMDVSPNGKEIAFIHRGEVFVSSIKEGTTKRITNTPEQERNLDFSPDGKSLLYSSERNGSWNLYTSSLIRKEETFFFNSTILKEEAVLEIPAETFQATFSPDGKEVAFLEERTALKVVNLQTKAVREIVPGNLNYSYSDGDQFYEWSPDGKWFLVNYLPDNQWIDQIGLVSSDGKGKIENLSKSGYGAYGSRWMMEGKMMIWFSSKDGQKNHGSWGGESDVYAAFFTQEAYDEFLLSEEEFEILKEKRTKEEEEKKKAEAEKKDTKKKGDDKDKKEEEIKPIIIQLSGLDDRIRRLTIHSSDLADAHVSNDGSKLFYLCSFEKGYDLWQTNLRTRETKILAKLGQGGGGIYPDKEGKFLYILAGDAVTSVDIEKGEMKPVAVKGEMVLNESAEREYLFEHIWRQVLKKFYVKDLHKVDWTFYKEEYRKLLPHINNNFDFADAMSEMLGELNASHTGAGYRHIDPNGDQTASLGLFYDESFNGNGLLISEVMVKSPVLKNNSKIAAGIVIEKMDGITITNGINYIQLLNRKAGHNMLLSLLNPKNSERWEEVVKPISLGEEGELRYKRWVENCRKIVEEKSGGKVGYVHVRGMNDGSYRKVYDDALGKNANKEALIVDTRFNGGGWLHDDLATFLSGKDYITFMPRDQYLGKEPQFKWRKPSAVVMSESNYSDAHMFPYTYRALGIGKLIGMPVPGTGTAVWWEGLQNGCWFGIPQVGMLDVDGDYLENKQLEPDIKVANDPGVVSKGRDQQLEKAVESLLGK